MSVEPVVQRLGDRLRHLRPGYVADPYPSGTSCAARARSPTPTAGASWLPTRYEDVAAIAHDVEHFSSRNVSVIAPPDDEDDVLPLGLPPISSDPPVHTWSRRLLLPWFSHRRVARVRAAHPRAVPPARRRLRRARARRRRRRVRAADPRAGHRRHARRAGRARRHVHRLGARRPRVRPRRGAASTRPHRDPDLPHRARSRPARRTRATT